MKKSRQKKVRKYESTEPEKRKREKVEAKTYRPNSRLQPFLLAWLSTPRRAQRGPQFILIGLNPPLQLRNIVPRTPIPPIKHIPHTDQLIPLRLEILQGALIPRPRLILQQALTDRHVLRGRADTLVEKRHVVGVNGIGAQGRFGKIREGLREAEVVCCDAEVAFRQPL